MNTQVEHASSEAHARSFAKGWDEGIRWYKEQTKPRLSDDEIKEIHDDLMQTNYFDRTDGEFYIALARAIEERILGK